MKFDPKDPGDLQQRFNKAIRTNMAQYAIREMLGIDETAFKDLADKYLQTSQTFGVCYEKEEELLWNRIMLAIDIMATLKNKTPRYHRVEKIYNDLVEKYAKLDVFKQ
jgi:hypothetical protein